MTISTIHKDVANFLRFMEWLYNLSGFTILGSSKSKKFSFSSCVIAYAALGLCVSSYIAFVEDTSFYVTSQHSWALSSFVMVFVRFANRRKHEMKMLELVDWYQDIHTRSYNPEYVTIVQKYQTIQNFQLKQAVW